MPGHKSKFNNKNKMSLNNFNSSFLGPVAPQLPQQAPQVPHSTEHFRRRVAAATRPADDANIFKDGDFPMLGNAVPAQLQGDWIRGSDPVIYGLKHAPEPVKTSVAAPRYTYYDDYVGEDYIDTVVMEPANDWDEF